MTKRDKAMGLPRAADQRRAPAPDRVPKKARRRRNTEAAEAALREQVERDKMERGRSWREFLLPENKAARKERDRQLRQIKCLCGHRGDKHRHWTGIDEFEIGWCTVCGRAECSMLRAILGCDPSSGEDYGVELGGYYDETGALHVTEVSIVTRSGARRTTS